MNFETLETKRLKLIGLTPENMDFIFLNLPKPEIKKLLGHQNEEEYLKEETKQKNGYASYNRSFMLFLLTHKETNTIIGRCGLHNWNKDHNRAEIGYALGYESFKRKGLMTEALEVIIEYGFKKLNLNRIEAMVGKNNKASLRLMEKFNFVQEGILRSHYKIEGQFEDSLVFSILVNEYQK